MPARCGSVQARARQLAWEAKHPLPRHWVKRESRSQPGRFYYFHSITQRRTWHRPGLPRQDPVEMAQRKRSRELRRQRQHEAEAADAARQVQVQRLARAEQLVFRDGVDQRVRQCTRIAAAMSVWLGDSIGRLGG